MKTLAAAVLAFIVALPAHAWEDCRSKAVEVELAAYPLLETEVFDSCIRENTLVLLHPISHQTVTSSRWWQVWPNAEQGRAVIGHPTLSPDNSGRLFIATFKNVEID